MALGLILAVALAFRIWQLDRFPPGLFGDEAVNGLDALDVLAGRPQVFFPANYGREGLHMLVLAPFIQALGPTALALRLPSVLAGVLTALATYWLGRELFLRTHLRGALVPLLAALLIGTSYWHVHFSRFGIRGVFTPLLATLAFACFWRGANQVASGEKHPWLWWSLAGLFLGLGVHFYTASRLVPVFLGVFLLAQWGLALLVDRAARDTGAGIVQASPGAPLGLGRYPPLLLHAFWPAALMAVVALAVFAPLGLYFLRAPGSLTRRADAVSLFNPEVSGGDPLGRLAQAALANVLQFFVPGQGDQAIFYNLPGRPVFDLLTAVLALVGLLLCLRAVWRGSSPHLFLLLWFPFMLIPTVLAVDRFPTLPRALGVLPGIYYFPALALGELWRWARRPTRPLAHQTSSSTDSTDGHPTEGWGRRGWPQWIAVGLLVAVLLVHAGLTARDYFLVWGPAPETFDAFEGDVAQAAYWLAERPGEEVYLASDIYRHPTFAYLHEKVPLTEILSYENPLVHHFDGRSSLPLPPAGQDATYLFTHNAGPAADLETFPSWNGFASWQDVPGPGEPALGIAWLEPPTDPLFPTLGLDQSGLLPLELALASNLDLMGYQLVRTRPDQAMLYLLWQTGPPAAGQYHGLQLQAGLASSLREQQLTQASDELTYRPTEWVAGGQFLSWLSLPLPENGLGEEAGRPLALVLRVVNQANGIALRPADDAQLGASEDGWFLLPLPSEWVGHEG